MTDSLETSFSEGTQTLEVLERDVRQFLATRASKPHTAEEQRESLRFNLEAWPEALRALSVPSTGFQLTQEERDFLFSIAGEGIDYPIEEIQKMVESLSRVQICADLIAKIDAKITTFPAPPFFKFGSRSPKDSPLFIEHHGRVASANDVIAFLLTSWRGWEDLAQSEMGIQAKKSVEYPMHLPWLWFREYRAWEPWQEFRCFMRNRQFDGATQYYGANEEVDGLTIYPQIVEHAAVIETAIKRFFAERFLPATEDYIESGVFDLAVDRAKNEITLIEINPAGTGTYPGLFSWEKMDFDGELRWLQDEAK